MQSRLPRVEDLTRDEKIRLVVGGDKEMQKAATNLIVFLLRHTVPQLPGAAGLTTAIPEKGIKSALTLDGPAGVRIFPDKGKWATAFPIGILLGSTWNPSAVYDIAHAIGEENRFYGAGIQLGPGMNIMRNPLCGRNYEYYSEDPIVSGKLAVGYVNGVQDAGVAACPKHFAANNHETNRMLIDSAVSKRALREVYLRGFEIVFTESKPWTMMTSYNKLNGFYTSTNPELTNTVLRDEWGFDGVVITDYYAGYASFAHTVGKPVDTNEQVAAGNDLVMPGMVAQEKFLEEGKMRPELLDAAAANMLKMLSRIEPVLDSFDPAAQMTAEQIKAHGALARKISPEGMVLLKNQGNVLPMSGKGTWGVFGVGAYETILGGTGSGKVYAMYNISIERGFRNAGIKLDESVTDKYNKALHKYREEVAKAEKRRQSSNIVDWIKDKADMRPKLPNEIDFTASELATYARDMTGAVLTISRICGEGNDRKLSDDYELTKHEMKMIKDFSAAFHAANKKVIVVLNIGNVIDVTTWEEYVDAILIAWQPGQEVGNAVVDVLLGKSYPSGHLSVTFPRKYSDCPSAKSFPSSPIALHAKYEDGIYVGYRYYTSWNVPVAYEFGFGLSYTTFEIGKPTYSSRDHSKSITVKFQVTNTGSRPGKEVIQLYLGLPGKDKPVKELRYFQKTKELAPGESEDMEFTIVRRDLCSFSESDSAWIAEHGVYTIEIGTSCTKIAHSTYFNLAQDIVVKKVNNVLNPVIKIDELHRL